MPPRSGTQAGRLLSRGSASRFARSLKATVAWLAAPARLRFRSETFWRGINVKRVALAVAAIGVMAASPTAASASFPPASDASEHRQAAFAGATLRLPFGGSARAAPEARLGIGLSHYRGDGSGFLTSRGGPSLAIATGVSRQRVELFVGGQSLADIERRLGAGGSSTTTLLVIGGLAAGAAALVLLLDGDDDDGPCPPGVEVCAF